MDGADWQPAGWRRDVLGGDGADVRARGEAVAGAAEHQSRAAGGVGVESEDGQIGEVEL